MWVAVDVFICSQHQRLSIEKDLFRMLCYIQATALHLQNEATFKVAYSAVAL